MPSQYSPTSQYEILPQGGSTRADGEQYDVSPLSVHSDIVALRPAMRVDVSSSYAEARKQAILDFERIYVEALLQRSGGNVSQAARDAKIDRVYLHRLIRRHRQ